ncbi:hypothetical protein IW136_003471 [Coemansia sp. RSA 678]|nr:hypothetical protein IW136_003471 [Coemansia sp. RSA 678]
MLKQITSIKATFCPFSPSSTSTKVFLNRIYSKQNTLANPQCKINVAVTDFAQDASRINVVFKDGAKMDINGAELHGQAIVSQVEKYARKLSQQEDLKSQ